MLRKTEDGRLFAPHRGKPPSCPDGYERDPHNTFLFVPILDSCQYREERVFKHGCCGSAFGLHCIKLDSRITSGTCKECQYGTTDS